MSQRRASAVILPALALLALSGCALVEPNGGGQDELSGLAACAQGHTWEADIPGLATQVQEILIKSVPTATAVGEGSQTLVWGLDSTMAVDADYTITITSTAAEVVTTIVEGHKGKASGTLIVSGEVAIPGHWKGEDYKTTTKVEVGGEAAETSPYALPPTGWDDGVGLEITCDGKTLTTHPRGGNITLTWTRAD